MASKHWLTESLDSTPYFYDDADFTQFLAESKIEEKRRYILDKFKDDNIKQNIDSVLYKRIRFIKAAKSFMTLEGEHIAFPLDNVQKLNLEAYYEACMEAYEYSKQPFFMPTQDSMLHLNAILLKSDHESSKYSKFLLRNDSCPLIMVGKGYFNPVEGRDVLRRTSYMLFDLSNTWFNDPIFVKGAKFVTEYVRIQPHMNGNKRTALMLLNAMLQSSGYPSIYFDKTRINELHSCIEESMITRNVTNFAKLIVKSIDKHYDHLIQSIELFEAEKSISEIENDKADLQPKTLAKK